MSTGAMPGESVRAWARRNQGVGREVKVAEEDALRFLCEMTIFRSRTLGMHVEEYRQAPEEALPHVQMFLAAPVHSVATAFGVKYLPRETPLVEAVAVIAESRFVVISGWEDSDGVIHPDTLWDQQRLFYKLLSCEDFSCEVHRVLDDVPEVPTLHVGCGLDEVMRIMCILHCEFVGLVNDCGNIESVVRFADIFQTFVKEINTLYCSRDDVSSSQQQPRRSMLTLGGNHNEELEIDDEVCALCGRPRRAAA